VTATVVLYGRPGCHLCDDARVVVQAVRTRRGFELVERDIETDEEWFKAYLERIPVVEIDGTVAFELFVTEPELEARLAGLERG
jgi:glutaredoxin